MRVGRKDSTSYPTVHTVELKAKYFPSFFLDSFGTPACKRRHVIVPIHPINSMSVENVALRIPFVDYLRLQHTGRIIVITAFGFVWDVTVAALPGFS